MSEIDTDPIIDFQSALDDYVSPVDIPEGNGDGNNGIGLTSEIDDSINSQSTILELGFNLVLDELRLITGSLDTLDLGKETGDDEEEDKPTAMDTGGIGKSLDKVFKGIGSQIKGVIGPAALLGEVMAGIMEPLDLIIEPFSILGELIGVQLLPFIEPLSDVLFDLIDPMLEVTGAVLGGLMPVFITLMPLIESLVPHFIGLSDLFITLLPVFEPLLPVITLAVDGLMLITEGMTSFVGGITTGVEFIIGIGDTIEGAFVNVVNFFRDLPGTIVTFIGDGLEDASADLLDFGRAIISFINPFD